MKNTKNLRPQDHDVDGAAVVGIVTAEDIYCIRIFYHTGRKVGESSD